MSIAQRWSHAKAAIGFKSAVAPLKVRQYAGAGYSRLMKGWIAYLQSADDALRGNLEILRARSRQLCKDNGEAAGLLLDFESDIAGQTGARLQFRAKKPRGAPLDLINDRVEFKFRQWGRRCTLDGKHDWASLARLLIRTVVQDGEFFAIKHRNPAYSCGYALQVIDADQVDASYNVAPDANGVAIVMGVEVDRYGKPLAYHVWERHPSSVNRGNRNRIAAENVLHAFKQVAVNQTRGIPWFAPALVTWKLGDQYTEAELVQSMLAAAQGGFFVNKNADAIAAPPQMRRNPATGKDEPVPLEVEVEPGMHKMLPPGWEHQAWVPTHPTANYVGFMKAVKRVIARAFGRAYASLTGDLESVNFSSMRIDRIREVEMNKLYQVDLLVRQFADVVFPDWISMASLTGELGVLPQAPAEMVQYATWMCRGWPWIDPLKDLAAAQLELQMRITSPQRLCAERGRDFYEIVDEIAEAQEYAELKKVNMEAVGLALMINAGDESSDNNNADSNDKNQKNRLRLAA